MMRIRSGLRRKHGVAAVLSLAGLLTIEGCRRNQTANIIDGSAGVVDNNGPDPADVNMAPVGGGAQGSTGYIPVGVGSVSARASMPSPAYGPQQGVGRYPQDGGAAPIERRAPGDGESYAQSGQAPPAGFDDGAYDDQVNTGMDAIEEADQPPPPLPVYEQPEAPGPNYLWTPGYWSYASAGYFWVPGAWCAAPYAGALWTPGYWGSYGNRYRFHHGFWGLHIGFYGGIPYGFGYTGSGYHGGYWRGNNFFYNRSTNHINTTRITNVYNRTVIVNNITNNRISYNGGRGGIQARPAPAEIAALREPRVGPMTAQLQNRREAAGNRQQFFKENGGRPVTLAAPRPFVADRGVPTPTRASIGSQVRPEQTQARPGEVQGPPGQSQGRPGPVQGRSEQGFHREGGPLRSTQPQTPGRSVQSEVRPGGQDGRLQPNLRPENQRQPQPGTRPAPAEGRPDFQARPEEQQRRPGVQSVPNRQGTPATQSQSNAGSRSDGAVQQQVRPMPQARPNSQVRPDVQGQPGQPGPRARPDLQARPDQQARPEQGARPVPQARPEQQSRPAAQTSPMQQARPQQQPRPAPQAPSVQQTRPQQQAAPEQRGTEPHGNGRER